MACSASGPAAGNCGSDPLRHDKLVSLACSYSKFWNLNLIDGQLDTSDGRSSRRKAATYTHNTKKMQTDIHASNGIRNFFLNFLIVIVTGGVQIGPLSTAATNRPMVPGWVVMMKEKLIESLAGETEVLGDNLLQCRFVHHKPP
jgi:hypothetical protein